MDAEYSAVEFNTAVAVSLLLIAIGFLLIVAPEIFL